MQPLTVKTISTSYGDKSIAVYAQDITALDEPIDVMAVSSFYRSYNPTRGTMLGALNTCGISTQKLSRSPEIDLREQCNIWLSRSIEGSGLPIGRIGCIEMSPWQPGLGAWRDHEGEIISSIQAYFHMLHIASLSGIKIGTVGFPILGAGNQRIDPTFITIPTINECIRFLKTNEAVNRICVISYNHSQAFRFARTLEDSYSALQDSKLRIESAATSEEKPLAFISYSSGDKNIADNLCAKLEAAGMRVWYAPRDIHSQDYASAIVDAITQCTHFVVILSKNSLQSHHVLNEIDLAFAELNRHVRFCPLKIDEEELGSAFRYYLSRQHWMDAHVPPLEKRLEEFVASIKSGDAAQVVNF